MATIEGKAVSSNRTIVGLKQRFDERPELLLQKQQSHHCGIETNHTVPAKLRDAGQQSHHCGIETDLVGRLPLIRSVAAIAPLWD